MRLIPAPVICDKVKVLDVEELVVNRLKEEIVIMEVCQ
jgi:hypothetical protein